MKIIEGLERIEKLNKAVATIGNFDGVHIGHQKIIQEVKQKAMELEGTSVLITFDPHPLSVLRPEKIRGLITPLPVKKKILEEMGIDILVLLRFEENFRNLEPEEFIRDVLVERIGISGLILGWDFRFGKNAKGDVNLIEELSKKYGFLFKRIDPIMLDGQKVGSNRIRKLIMEGDVRRAKDFLGRPFAIKGRVVYGAGIGKKIGFPTANLAFLDNQLLPKNGVYATEIEFQGNYLPSVTNVGFKPTFNYDKIFIETHILGFNQDIYGMELEIRFYERIRDEAKFDSLEDLKRAINDDVQRVRVFFGQKL